MACGFFEIKIENLVSRIKFLAKWIITLHAWKSYFVAFYATIRIIQ